MMPLSVGAIVVPLCHADKGSPWPTLTIRPCLPEVKGSYSSLLAMHLLWRGVYGLPVNGGHKVRKQRHGLRARGDGTAAGQANGMDCGFDNI